MFDFPQLQNIHGLDVASTQVDTKAPTALIFHGYGANAYDLWSLQSELQVGRKINWYFPNGILGLNMGPGYAGRAWFPINEKAIEQAALTGKTLDYSQIYPPGLDRAKDLILNWVAKQNLDLSQLVLGGFSQGAMLALEVSLHLPQPPAGLMLLSGTLFNENDTLKKAQHLAKNHKTSFFQSHGQFDPVLPFAGAEKLRDLLENAGWKSNWDEFEGGHEIPRSTLRAASFYLKKCLEKN